ncbi:5-formyltetrahydrofolate cyclo-ligase [Marinobacter sp.]|uniref:5-formyltetrahydrofolate cyclo-ligase n=1 Tax=Marinobacter sp. TaxID=50741 RepID=UPI003A8DDDF9
MSQTIDSHTSESGFSVLSRNELRKHLRQRRRMLSTREQEQAASSLALNLLKNPDLHRARHVAIYLPNDGEIDPHPYMALALRKGIRFYLPVLHPIHPGRLVFSPYFDGVELTSNRFGIPEPAFSNGLRRPAWALDAVLFPLVGFDESGGRLGMGGGFYDRTFAFTRLRPRLAPKLIGLAHDFQKVEKLSIEPWDVPLHSVATDRRLYRVK